jgi:hypothetical protein
MSSALTETVTTGRRATMIGPNESETTEQDGFIAMGRRRCTRQINLVDNSFLLAARFHMESSPHSISCYLAHIACHLIRLLSQLQRVFCIFLLGSLSSCRGDN